MSEKEKKITVVNWTGLETAGGWRVGNDRSVRALWSKVK